MKHHVRLHSAAIEPLYRVIGQLPEEQERSRAFGTALAERLDDPFLQHLTPQRAARMLGFLIVDCVNGESGFESQPLPAILRSNETETQVELADAGLVVRGDSATATLGNIGLHLFGQAYGSEFLEQVQREFAQVEDAA